MQLSKKIVLGLSLALSLVLVAPETSKACFWPFAPPGSFAAWRAQNLQRRSMRLNMVAQRRAMLFGGYGAYGCGGYSTYGYAGGCCPTGYSNFGGCPTGGCGTGCATTTFYAPYSYGYACNTGCCTTGCGTNGCASGGCYSSDVQGTGTTSDNKTSNISNSTSTFASDKVPTPVIESKSSNGVTDDGFKEPSKDEIYNSNGGNATPFKMKSMKLNLDPQDTSESKKEIKTPNADEKTKKEEVFTIPLPKTIDVEPQIAWNKSIRRSRVGRNARFTLPIVARSTEKVFRPIDIIERAETQIASK